jgi:AraC family transcriptional regulator
LNLALHLERSSGADFIVRIPDGTFRGDILQARKLNGLILARTSYAANLRVPPHSHAHARLLFVLRGGFQECYESSAREAGPALLIARPPGETHSHRIHASGAVCLAVDIDPRWLERARECGSVLQESTEFRGGLITHLAHRLHGEFLMRDDVAPLAIESILLGIVAETARRREYALDTKPPRWLVQAREFLDAHFTAHLTLEAVADVAGVHPVHLARTFRACYRCTIGDYLRRLRIEYASHEIASSELSLSQVALAAGFADQSHFTRLFRQHTGMTPAQYRDLSRGRFLR